MKIERIVPDRIEDLLLLVREYHAFDGIDMQEPTRRRAVGVLLADPGLGTVWAIAGDDCWIGYVAITYGYSIEFGGRDAFIDEFYIREDYRGCGVGGEVLDLMKVRVKEAGVVALHLEVDLDNSVAQALYDRKGFELRDRHALMSVKL